MCEALDEKLEQNKQKLSAAESPIAEQKTTINALWASKLPARKLGAPDPDIFSGHTDAFEPWLSRLEFKVKNDETPAEVAIPYAISSTGGTAFQILLQRDPRFSANSFTTFREVVELLREVYACGPEWRDWW